jgi:hypothetical protein
MHPGSIEDALGLKRPPGQLDPTSLPVQRPIIMRYLAVVYVVVVYYCST